MDMILTMLVYARTRFVGFHQWKDAPEVYKHLAFPHRHEFHVEVGVEVKKGDREVEFQDLKSHVNAVIKMNEMEKSNVDVPIRDSCEVIAMRIASDLRDNYDYNVRYVDVSEDGECGGRVEYR